MSIQHLIASLYTEFAQDLEQRVARQFHNLDAQRVEDACSHAWEQIARRTTMPPEPQAWLTRVAYNAAIALYHEQKDEVSAEVTAEATESFDLPTSIDLDTALAQLKPAQRLVLTYWSRGYSYAEIEALTSQTRTWVNRHLAEGKEALRQIMRE